jgi:hypothetical protein
MLHANRQPATSPRLLDDHVSTPERTGWNEFVAAPPHIASENDKHSMPTRYPSIRLTSFSTQGGFLSKASGSGLGPKHNHQDQTLFDGIETWHNLRTMTDPKLSFILSDSLRDSVG